MKLHPNAVKSQRVPVLAFPRLASKQKGQRKRHRADATSVASCSVLATLMLCHLCTEIPKDENALNITSSGEADIVAAVSLTTARILASSHT